MKRLSFKKTKPTTPFLPWLSIPASLLFPSPPLDLRIPATGTPQDPLVPPPATHTQFLWLHSLWAHSHQVLNNPFSTIFFNPMPIFPPFTVISPSTKILSTFQSPFQDSPLDNSDSRCLWNHCIDCVLILLWEDLVSRVWVGGLWVHCILQKRTWLSGEQNPGSSPITGLGSLTS